MTETEGESRLKRLRMRSWRRGIKEMDLILGPFADDWLARLDDSALDTFEAILGENDHDLYQWVTARIGRHDAAGGQAALGPSAYDALMTEIAAPRSKKAGSRDPAFCCRRLGRVTCPRGPAASARRPRC